MKLGEERRDIYPNSFLFLTVRAQLSPGFAAPSKVARQRVLVSVDPQLQRGLSSKEMTSKPSIFPFVPQTWMYLLLLLLALGYPRTPFLFSQSYNS